MLDNFKALPDRERIMIIAAGLEEFGKKGYLRASTNVMVQQAGIPKGTLFYYFGSKKDFFLYLVDHAILRYQTYMKTEMRDMPREIFTRMLYIAELRMHFAVSEPLLYQFLLRALVRVPEDVRVEMAERFTVYEQQGMAFLTDDIDTRSLRPGVSRDTLIGLIGLILEGLMAKYSPELAELSAQGSIDMVQSMVEETKSYFDIIQHGVYQK